MIPSAFLHFWLGQPQEDLTSRSGADHVEEREAFISGRESFDQEPLTTWIIRKLLQAWRDMRQFVGSEEGVGIFKCCLAYLVASLAVFTPIGKILGRFGEDLQKRSLLTSKPLSLSMYVTGDG
ncbi:hypothetical protein N7541_009484 [Penicillium brevicompactum]|uniref:Uncharacterized protein n=1 Tax=Penicillium brevicompactum TaxID=5074 RepID=A0A9W9QN27_PENBR|nr:hypothetical protein N7541_009484 [Penicillium brevicompactum]